MMDGLVGRLFRSPWPTNPVDQLLRAALLKDDSEAGSAWRIYQGFADFDHLEEAEFRLLGLVSTRLATIAPDSPMRARIGGIGKMHWSRSQIAVGEAGPSLRALAAGAIDVLAIKGGSLIAADDMSARGRIVNIVDIVVRPDDMPRAFDILIDNDWTPVGSGTALFHRAYLANATTVALVRGRFGNLDLYRTPFRAPYMSIPDDAPIWARAVDGRLANAPVRVPSAPDAVAIALADGTRVIGKNSDSIVDIVACTDRCDIDWELLESIVDRRGLHYPAAVLLRYVQQRLQRAIPESLLVRLENGLRRRPTVLFVGLRHQRPRQRGIGLSKVVRGVTGRGRLWQGGDRPVAERRPRSVRPSMSFRWIGDNDNPGALDYALTVPDRRAGEAWNGRIDVTLSVKRPRVSRRVEFEVNSNGRHLLRLRALLLGRGTRQRMLRFRFSVSLEPGDTGLWIVSAPSRSFNTGVSEALIARYGALRFGIADLRIKRGR